MQSKRGRSCLTTMVREAVLQCLVTLTAPLALLQAPMITQSGTPYYSRNTRLTEHLLYKRIHPRNRKHRLHSPCCQCRDALLGACCSCQFVKDVAWVHCRVITLLLEQCTKPAQLHTGTPPIEDPSYGDLMPPKLPKTSFCCSCKHGLCLGPYSYSARQGCSRLSRAL